MNNLDINSYCEDDSFKNRTPRTSTNRGGNSVGKIAKPKTEWTNNNERGPTLNSKHYKLLSKKTLDSIQGMKSVNPDRLSTGSTTPSSTVKSSLSNTSMTPKIIVPKIIVNNSAHGLEIIVEEVDSSNCSKKVEKLPQPVQTKVMKPIRSNLSSASTDTIDITGNSNENSCFHEINVSKTKKRDDSLSEHKISIHDKKHSDLQSNNRHSTSIQKLLHFKTSEYSMSGSIGGQEEHASLLMPTSSGRPRNDSDCTIDYNCCSDDSTEKKAVVSNDQEVDVCLSKPGKVMPSRRGSKDEDVSVEPEVSCSKSQQDLKSPVIHSKPIPIKTMSASGGGEWCGLEDSSDERNQQQQQTAPECSDHTEDHKEVGVKCSCVIC